MSVTAYPLCWPQGWPRTGDRKVAKFWTIARAAIKARFRELASKHHPDVGGDHGRMAEISAARDRALQEIGAAL